MLSGSITIRRRCGKIFSNPGLFLIFSSFSHHNSNLNWKSADVVLGNRTQGRKLIVEDGSTELKRPPMKEVWVATKDQLKIWFVQAAATNTQSETKRIIPNVFFLFLWQDIFDNKLAVPCNEKNQSKCQCLLGSWTAISVTKFSPLSQYFASLWQNFEGLFLIWQNIKPTLPHLFHHWANFHCYKWSNIET